MNWDALGAVGEVVGAIAVIVTLLFLIFQLRQNTKAIENETIRANLEQGTSWIYQIAQDSEMARLYRTGLEGALESPDDRIRFHLLMQALFNQWAMAYIFSTDKMPGLAEADIVRVLSTPGGQRYWERALELKLHAPDFVQYISSIYKRVRVEA